MFAFTIIALAVLVVALATFTIYRFVTPGARTWKRRRLTAPLPLSGNVRMRDHAACCGSSPFYRGRNFRRAA